MNMPSNSERPRSAEIEAATKHMNDDAHAVGGQSTTPGSFGRPAPVEDGDTAPLLTARRAQKAGWASLALHGVSPDGAPMIREDNLNS